MLDGLIGHTGFVGGNLLRQLRFDRTFHRPTVHQIAGLRFRRLVISAMPAVKWRANADPAADAASADDLIGHLTRTTADEAVLISTIEVYPDPRGVDESTGIEPDQHTRAYGRNRLRVEKFVQAHFPRSLVVRLPALFGPGLKKNLLYDLTRGRAEEFCHRDSVFQFYGLHRLGRDIETALQADLAVLNLATAPISAREVAEEIFGRRLSRTDLPRVDYDMQTRHAALFGGPPPYLSSRQAVLAELRAFVASEAAPSRADLAGSARPATSARPTAASAAPSGVPA